MTPLNASIEASYRFYHDSYGIIANTVGVQWFQKIGQAAVVSPSFRYYRQGAANFYGIQFPGDPNFDAGARADVLLVGLPPLLPGNLHARHRSDRSPGRAMRSSAGLPALLDARAGPSDPAIGLPGGEHFHGRD